jgi:hypothetical protein
MDGYSYSYEAWVRKFIRKYESNSCRRPERKLTKNIGHHQQPATKTKPYRQYKEEKRSRFAL